MPMEIEPTDGQMAAFVAAWESVDHNNLYAGLRAALNYEEPYGPEDEKYDFALKTTDMVSGDGTYAAVNVHNPDPGVQRAILRWRERK